MSNIKGAVHHHICSNRLWDVVAGAAHHHICSKRLQDVVIGAAHRYICSKRLYDVVAGAAHRNLKLRCAAPYAALFVLGYKYYAALPLWDWKIIFSPLNTEGV